MAKEISLNIVVHLIEKEDDNRTDTLVAEISGTDVQIIKAENLRPRHMKLISTIGDLIKQYRLETK